MNLSCKIRYILLRDLDSPSLLSRKNDLAYRIAVLFFIFALPYAPLFILLNLPFSAAIVVASMLMFGASIVLNRLKYYKLSKVMLISGPALGFFVCANILTPYSGAQLLLFTIIPLPFLLFEIAQICLIMISALIPIFLYITLELGNYQWIKYTEIISQNALLYVRISAIMTTFLLLAASATSYFISNRRYELKIEEKNKNLEKTNSVLSEKNIQIRQHVEELEKANKLIEEKANEEKTKQEAELELAKELQARYLTDIPHRYDAYPTIRFATFYLPTKQLSGDYYCATERNGHFRYALVDVTGKSVEAALVMVHVHTIIQPMINSDDIPDLSEMMSKINTHFCRLPAAKKASDVFLLDLDMDTLTLRYSNGGLETAYIIRNQSVIPLGVTGMKPGFEEGEPYETFEEQLEQGDLLLISTDGFIEMSSSDVVGNDAKSKRKARYGYERLEQFLTTQKWTENTLKNGIITEMERYHGSLPVDDDTAFLIVSIEV